MGLQPVLLADSPTRYSFASEDGLPVVPAETSSFEPLCATAAALAGREGIAGVTSSSEYFIATAARLANALNLPSPDYNAIDQCRNKYTQRARCRSYGIPTPKFAAVDRAADVLDALSGVGLPAVVKPVDGTGSSGVLLCRTCEEACAHARSLLMRSGNERGLPIASKILIEEFVDGPEYSIETFDVQVVGITAKHLGRPPHFVEVGHDFPADIPEPARDAMHKLAIHALRALGLGWGPAHIEVRSTPSGPVLIEVNPRLAGGFLPSVVHYSTGIDLIRQTLNRTIGAPVALTPSRRLHSSIRFVLARAEGALNSFDTEQASQHPAGAEVRAYRKSGDIVGVRNDFRDRIGHAIAVAPTSPDAAAAAEQMRDSVRVRLA